jgi:hypothetical protein
MCVSRVHEALLQQKCCPKTAQNRVSSAKEGYLHQRQSQIFIALGRSIHCSGHSSIRGLCASKSLWRHAS